MSYRRTARALGRSAACLVLAAAAALAQEPAADEHDDWPRVIALPKATIVIQPPQVEALEGDHLTARAAIEVTVEAQPPVEGVIWFRARFVTDRDERTVSFPDITVERIVAADAKEEGLRRVKALVESDLLGWDLEVSLDRFSAGLRELEQRKTTPPALKSEPPAIVFASTPTELVLVDGEPKLRELPQTTVMQVVNTPVFMAHDPGTKTWFVELLRDWYQAPAVAGPWTKCQAPPAAVATAREKLAAGAPAPAAGAPAPAGPVAVLVATTPTELVVTDGEAEWSALEGTGLVYLANAEADVFKHGEDGRYFINISGRWFAAASLGGPWGFVAADALPAGFAKIPDDSPKAHVRAFVAGTDEAEDALLDAQVPQTAAIKRADAKLEVTWDGAPQFAACEGAAGVEYGVNTSFAVFRVQGKLYCCHEGVWFVASAPEGPWAVCDEVPDAIYSVQPSCPNYASTYCHVYEATDDTVYVGYTGGYTGCYPYYGSVWYGTGYHYPYWYGNSWYGRPITYGYGVRYNNLTGHWNVAAGVRGPYGGVGVIGGPNGWVGVGTGGACGVWGGTWRGGAVPYGRLDNANLAGGRALDPDRTNLYGARGDLAQRSAGRRADRRPPQRTAPAAPGAQRAPRPPADRYASRDGEVVRRTPQGVERRQGGQTRREPAPTRPPREQVARQRGQQRTQSYQQYRQTGGWNGARGGGGGARGGGGRGGGGRR